MLVTWLPSIDTDDARRSRRKTGFRRTDATAWVRLPAFMARSRVDIGTSKDSGMGAGSLGATERNLSLPEGDLPRFAERDQIATDMLGADVRLPQVTA